MPSISRPVRALCLTLALLPLALGLAACSVARQAEGTFYLRTERYDACTERFRDVLASTPSDPEANFYTGRCLLADDEADRALPYLKKAADLKPGNAEYRFWVGVAAWGVYDPKLERSSYEKALSLDPTYLPARLYLGHNLLDAGDAAGAIRQYDLVLARQPENPDALARRADALRDLGRDKQAVAAYLAFLALYPAGGTAHDAVESLNRLGDYTYRNFVIGLRDIPLRAITFDPTTGRLARESLPALDTVGALLGDAPDLTIHVVAYVNGDAETARKRAVLVRDAILRTGSGARSGQMRLSWFGTGESLPGATTVLTDSVNFFTDVESSGLSTGARK